jgi:hypothetical protein
MKRLLLVTDDYLQLYKTLQLFLTLHEMQTYTNIFTNAKVIQNCKLMRLCHPPDGSASPKYKKLLCFKPPKFILPNTECTSF